MEQKELTKNIKFENNTIYSFKEKRIDFFMEDCPELYEDEYYLPLIKYLPCHRPCIYLKDKENIVLDFNCGTLFANGPLSPFIIRDCNNVEIKNVSICFDRAFHTQMTVVEKGEGCFKCVVDPRFPYRVEDGKFIPYSKYWEDTRIHESCVFLQEFDPVTLKGLSWPVVLIGNKDKEAAKQPWGGYGYYFDAVQDGEYLVFKGNVPDFQVGSILALAVNNRDIASIFAYNSKNIKLTNVRIVNGLGFGFLPVYCENITVDQLILKYDKETSIGIINNTADAIHSVSCKGDFVVRNSYISGMIDDAMNIHSLFFCLDELKDNILTISLKGAACKRVKHFDVGDTIAIYDGDSLIEADRAVITKALRISEDKFEITLNKAIKPVKKDSLIENLSAQCNLYVDNCFFGKANSHIRFQTRGKIRMTNCISEIPVILTGDTYYWYESSPVNDLIISNCVFDRPSTPIMSIPEYHSSAKAPFYHEHIWIDNCVFKSDEMAYLRQTDKIKITNCKNEHGHQMSVRIENCGSLQKDEDLTII